MTTRGVTRFGGSHFHRPEPVTGWGLGLSLRSQPKTIAVQWHCSEPPSRPLGQSFFQTLTPPAPTQGPSAGRLGWSRANALTDILTTILTALLLTTTVFFSLTLQNIRFEASSHTCDHGRLGRESERRTSAETSRHECNDHEVTWVVVIAENKRPSSCPVTVGKVMPRIATTANE